jgi:hypothetical protein
MSDREAFEKAYHKETGLYASYAPDKKCYTDVIANMCYRVWQAALEFERQAHKAMSEANDRMVWGD